MITRLETVEKYAVVPFHHAYGGVPFMQTTPCLYRQKYERHPIEGARTETCVGAGLRVESHVHGLDLSNHVKGEVTPGNC